MCRILGDAFAGLFAAQSFAQPRDLFAEFEAEAEAAGVPEELRGAAFASFLDQRECELGWD